MPEGPEGTPGSGGESGDAGEKLQADNTRLRQELAKQEDLNKKALPWVRTAIALRETETGKVILEKLKAGEDLTELQLVRLEKAAKEGSEGDPKPLTSEEIDEKLRASEERVSERLVATLESREAMKTLDVRALKELAGYEKLKGTSQWREQLNLTLFAIQKEALTVPKGEDPYWFALRNTYGTLVAMDPDIVKGTTKASGKSADERLAEILAAGSKPSASGEEGKDELANLPEEYQKQIKQIRSIGTGVIGKSFSGS